MSEQNRAVKQFQASVAILLFLRYALIWATGWTFLWGTGVLIARAAFGVPQELLLWGGLGIPVTCVLAALLAWRRIPAPVVVRSLMDGQSKCGGLLMASQEENLGSWKSRMPALNRLKIRWRGGRMMGLFFVSLLFVLVGFLFPDRYVALAGTRSQLEIDHEVEKLAEKIETLKEEKVLDLVRAEELEEQLQQVRDEAVGEDPGKTWEALDNLEMLAEKIAKEAAEQAISETEKLTKAEKLAKALEESMNQMDPKDVSEAMAELSKMVEKANEESKEVLQKEVSDALKNAAKEGKLSPEQLKEITEAMKGGKKELMKKLEKLHEAGMLDLKTLKQCEKMGKCDSSALAQFLSENSGEMSIEEMLDAEGRGGIDRGPGAANLNWTDGSSEDGVKFKEQVLPPSSLQAIKESVISGVSKGNPSVNTDKSKAKSGALSNAKSGGGSAHTQTILPRHRGTVQRYFDRD